MKYEVLQYTEILVYPSHYGGDLITDVSDSIREALSDGFEIYHALPFSVDNCAGIKYILRRPKLKKNE